MELFLDTANIDEIRDINDLGIISGVTTNPSLIAKEGKDFKSVVQEITSIVDGPISAEVISLEADGMIAEAGELAAIHPNIVIKVPLTEQGIKATSRLSQKG
ncbi:MAG: fructose-6-phosphate aldolase, partial [Spirochaetota bacterium]|nr:fructose-6-phosphate aldolase [Spirochaetota bacterium]